MSLLRVKMTIQPHFPHHKLDEVAILAMLKEKIENGSGACRIHSVIPEQQRQGDMCVKPKFIEWDIEFKRDVAEELPGPPKVYVKDEAVGAGLPVLPELDRVAYLADALLQPWHATLNRVSCGKTIVLSNVHEKVIDSLHGIFTNTDWLKLLSFLPDSHHPLFFVDPSGTKLYCGQTIIGDIRIWEEDTSYNIQHRIACVEVLCKLLNKLYHI